MRKCFKEQFLCFLRTTPIQPTNHKLWSPAHGRARVMDCGRTKFHDFKKLFLLV